MIFNNSVTVYHDCGGRFIRKFYVRASVFSEEKLDAKNGKRVAKNGLTVRVFTNSDKEISAGDRLVLGYCEQKNPPENSYLILNSKPNFIGTRGIRHYKIYAV